MADVLRVADAVEFLRGLEAGSVSAVVTDPPYFRVKDEPWDRQWDTAAGFLEWLGGVLVECGRVLAPNGSLYVFASPQLSARVEVLVGERFHVLNRITWAKPPFATKAEMFRKDDLRAFFPSSESIVFAEPWTASDSWVDTTDGIRGSVFEPIRQYLDGERQRAGVTKEDLNRAMGFAPRGMAETRYFGRSQWQLPTAEHYETMRRVLAELNGGGDYLRREYDDLRREYDDLRREYDDLRREYETLRRPFYATPDRPYTDVWTYPTVSHYQTLHTRKHPCEKPLAMMEHIIATSTRPGDLVVDPFMGSGTTGVAAARLGRRFAGCDLSSEWVEYARLRIEQETNQLRLDV